jgi:uncharacterized protein (TIGR00730 family)
MAELRSICVYCGSNAGADPRYGEAAEALGRAMAESGVRLVYGGGSIGLMGILARTVLAHGGKVTGIIPQFLKDRELMLKEVSDLVVTADMHERKRTMFERSDAFVALPGGIGTLEEFFEAWTAGYLGMHDKPLVLLDPFGHYDGLVTWLHGLVETGYVSPGALDRLLVVDDVDAALAACSPQP